MPGVDVYFWAAYSWASWRTREGKGKGSRAQLRTPLAMLGLLALPLAFHLDPLELPHPSLRGALLICQEEPGGARRNQEEPGGARRSQEPGGARRSQEELGGLPGLLRSLAVAIDSPRYGGFSSVAVSSIKVSQNRPKSA